MKTSSLTIFISFFAALPFYASNEINHSVLSGSLGSHQVITYADQEARSLQLDDLATKAQCEICSTFTTNLCMKCRRKFYCSPECKKYDWKYHKKECYDYNSHIYLPERTRLNNFLNSYYDLNCLQYYTEEEQRICLEGFLRITEGKYQLIIPQSIKLLIFKEYYDLHTAGQFRVDLEILLKLNATIPIHPPTDLNLSSDHYPTHLIQLLQYIYHKQEKGELNNSMKEKIGFLFQKISFAYWYLGFYSCFGLQKN